MLFSSLATNLYTPPTLSQEAAILSPTPNELKQAPWLIKSLIVYPNGHYWHIKI